jgi:signal transduction histidine kinase
MLSSVRAGLADWWRARSLRTRLSWSASAVVAVWVLLLTLGANLLIGRALAGQADSVLQARAEAAAITLDVGADGTVRERGGQDDQALDVGTWIIVADRVVEGPPNSSAALDRTAVGMAARGQRAAEFGGEDPRRLYALPVVRGGDQVATVVTSTSLAPYRSLERLALAGSVPAALLLLLLMHLVLRANVGRALRPVQQMSAQAGRWSADDVDRRFGPGPRPAELADLAGTLDGVLDRLSAVLRHEQRLTAELSHELRTPLAGLRAEVDLARDRPVADPTLAAGLAAIDGAAAELQQIVETLLSAGRTGRRTAPGRSRVAEVLATSTATGRPGVTLTVEVDPDLVTGVDAAVLQRLLAPLLANASRYARSAVTVRAAPSPAGVLITVEDDGPGVPATDVERVFAPGWRADPADDHPGGGLGLALARRLATACGGTVSCRPGPGGRFDVQLPPG